MSVFRCPRDAKGSVSYVYIDWKKLGLSMIPDYYPVIYERKMFHGRGVFVGLGSGAVVWDEDFRFLKQFSSKHPEIAFRITK